MIDGIPNWLLDFCQKDIVEVMGEFPKTMGVEQLNRCILLVLLFHCCFAGIANCTILYHIVPSSCWLCSRYLSAH